MSDAYKCDRCGEFGQGQAPNTATIENSKGGIPKIGDEYLKSSEWQLCPNCSQQIKKLLQFPEVSFETKNGEIAVVIDE